MRIAVLVPCYNEAATVVRGFRTAFPAAEVYVYDNNSTDGTAARAREARATVRQEGGQGKARDMSFAGCWRTWMPTSTSWWMEATRTTLLLPLR